MNNLKIKYVKPSTLEPYDNNSRTHSEEQIQQVADSITEFGFTNPILINETGRVIAGHARLAASVILSLDKVPTITLAGLSDEQRRAYVIADNKLALNAGWDFEMLKFELESLTDHEMLQVLTGFGEFEIAGMLEENPITDPSKEWEGMPEFSEDDAKAYRSIVMHFTCEEHVEMFRELVKIPFTEKTKFIWYPVTEIGVVKDKRYSDES